MSPWLHDAERLNRLGLESRLEASVDGRTASVMEAEAAPAPLRRALTLMIDDELALAKAMEIRLASIDIEVEAALTGAQGVAQAQRMNPQLILLDVRLPDMDGFEALRRILGLPGRQRTPVIFVTASANDATRRRAREAGARAFFAKPFDAGRLVQRIQLELAPSESDLPTTQEGES